MKKSGQPHARTDFSMVWTGNEVVIWGGRIDRSDGTYYTVSDGKRYDPGSDT